MKLSFLRASALVALAAGLSACGGKASFDLGGPVGGLKYPGLVLKNTKNGDTLAVSPTDTTFTMPASVEYGDEYAVVVATQPQNQGCIVLNGADTAGRLSSIVIAVQCKTTTFSIGGTVTGLRATADTTSTGLVIANGSKQKAIEVDGAYTFPEQVAYDDSYSVDILKQPTDTSIVCVVENPVGVVKSTLVTDTTVTPPADVVVNPVNNINIACRPKA